MPILELKKQLVLDIASHLESLVPGSKSDDFRTDAFLDLGTPPNPAMGHVALACFRLAKKIGLPADQLARSVSIALSKKGLIATPAGPYANIRWPTQMLIDLTLDKAIDLGAKYGTSAGNDKVVVIEYCSPNIAKRLGFQHIRSTLIGNALSNIYRSQGYRVERTNFVGDWGSQFARLLAAFSLWGDPKKLHETSAMDHLMEVYVRFHKEADLDPSLLDKASAWLKRLEAKDEAATNTWRTIREVSLSAMEVTLERLGVRFDHTEGESHYIDAIESTLERVKTKAQAKISEGAWIVELEGISTPALIQKRDGTTLYLTRDIAAAIDRFNRLNYESMLYVVSDQQRLHFEQLFATLAKMEDPSAKGLVHVGFGTVLFGKEKMSTREGRVILLDDILNEAHALALKECTSKNPNLEDKETVAEIVGVGAVIFGQLSNHRTRDIRFDWKEVLALDGDTGPYVQYSLVRARSLLEKAPVEGVSGSEGTPEPFHPEEDALVLQIGRFRSEIDRARRENEPFFVASYLIDLAKAFNRFYFKMPVLQASSPMTRKVRLKLVKGAAVALENGLGLLGIRVPERM